MLFSYKNIFQKIYIIAILSLAFTKGFSQNDSNSVSNKSLNKKIILSFSGKIIDAKKGNPLPGASIFIADLHRGSIAADDGSFTIQNVPIGKYLVEITNIGYASQAENVDLKFSSQKNFALNPTALEQEAVTITGVSSATRIKQSPQPVEIIKRQDFINTASTNAIDAITKLVPGVNAVTTGPAISKPFIRGLGYTRILTINDGVRQEGQQWGDEHGIEIDDYSVQRVEVLKGPASLMYGSDAIAGVINIQSQVPAPEGTIKANLLTEYQSNNALRGFYANIGGTKSGFSWNTYGTYKAASDYKNKYDGYVLNSKFNNKDYGAMLAYTGNWGYSHLYLSNFDQHTGITEGERDSTSGQFIKALPGGQNAIADKNDFKSIDPEIPFQRIRHFKISTENNFKIGDSRADLILGYQQNQRQEFGNADDANTPNAWFNLQTLNYAIRWHLPYTKNLKTTIGISGMYQTNENKTADVLIPDYNLFDMGGFVFTQYVRGKLTISGGLRYDRRIDRGKALVQDGEIKFSAFNKSYSNLSGSAGASYEITKAIALKCNLARGFRAPNFAELASNGAHEGTNRFEIGNNNLRSEISLQGDAGIEITTEHLSLEANIFYNHIKDFIFYEKTPKINGGDSILIDNETGNQLQVFRFAQSNANLYGAELSLDVHPHPLDWLHIKNSFSYTRGRFAQAIDGSNNIPFVPGGRLVSAVSIDILNQKKYIGKLRTGIESDYTFKQARAFTGYNTETPTPGYWLVGANISADFVTKGKTICSLTLTCENIGDIAYQNHLSRFKYLAINNATGRQGVFNMGRNFGVKLNVPLEL